MSLPAYFEAPEAAVWQRAAAVRALVLDVDGVLTDGSVLTGADGEALKAFHIHDGHGIRMAQHAGIEVAWLSARESPAVARRAADLGVTRLTQGCRDKAAGLAGLLEGLGLAPAAAAYVGDDLIDLAPLARVGLAVAVADAHPAVAAAAHWRTRRPGGRGAVREVCELLVAARGALEAAYADHAG